VVLKIIKHAQEDGGHGSGEVNGVLLGLVQGRCLEVTNSFPFPRHTDEDDMDDSKSPSAKTIALKLTA
jgi:translation initiation factor 3 subunit H